MSYLQKYSQCNKHETDIVRWLKSYKSIRPLLIKTFGNNTDDFYEQWEDIFYNRGPQAFWSNLNNKYKHNLYNVWQWDIRH